MKLLYIASIRLPTEKAHGVQIMKTCEAFSNMGIETCLSVPRFLFLGLDKEDPFAYYNVKRLFKIRRIWSLRLIRMGPIGFFLEIFIFFIGLVFTSDFWRADYVFSRDEVLCFLASFLGRKTIWETHTGSYNFFAKNALRKANLVVAISQGLKNFYTEKGVDAHKIVVAHDSVDLKDFDVSQTKVELRRKYELSLDKKIILYVGRLDGWKGVKVFLDATKYFKENQVALVIGGDQSQIEFLSKDYPKVIFWGYRQYKDLPLFQKLADVLVVPNTGTSDVSKFFTSPLKVFAYMASGVPIVASDLPSIREILNEDNAVLVEPDNPQAFLEGINTILGDQTRAINLTTKALEDVTKYSWTLRVQRILSSLK